MTILTPTRHSTDLFTRTNTREFVAEMSDLHQVGGQPILSRVWDDACDTGMTLVSTKTGHGIVMVVEHERARQRRRATVDRPRPCPPV